VKPPFGDRTAVLRCGRCGRLVDWGDAQLQVVCGCRPHLELPPVLVREATAEQRDRALELFNREFGRKLLIANGEPVTLDDAPALVAVNDDDEIAGALAWRHFDDAFHVLALATDPLWQRAGIGGHLVAEAELLARRQQQPRMIVTISNDNLPALYFYQRRGYRIAGIIRDSMKAYARDHEAVGFAGIPIVDEIQLVKSLKAVPAPALPHRRS
jgi:ribosomal protein S18 acetylase RimI-like enzyme